MPPHMLPNDAARLIIATLATDSPARAVEQLERFRHLPVADVDQAPVLLSAGDPTFEQALTRIIAADPEQDIGSPYVEIRRWDKSARIEIGQGRLAFRSTLTDAEHRARVGKQPSCGLAPSGLMELRATLWADRFRGADADGYPLGLHHAWNNDLTGKARQDRYAAMAAYVQARDADWMRGT